MVRDMFSILVVRHRVLPCYGLDKSGEAVPAPSSAAAAASADSVSSSSAAVQGLCSINFTDYDQRLFFYMQ